MRRAGIVIAVVLPVLLLGAPGAQAFIYWADFPNGTIGRANNDGSGANDSFITGASGPFAVAVDSAHIYWANQTGNSIGRANLDGTGANQNFITGLQAPSGVAVTSSYVFWSTAAVSSQKIGRANLDGSSPNPNLISTILPCGIAVDSGHVYWVSDNGSPSYIGRASFSGSPSDSEFVEIPGTSFPCGVAVNTANVFWSDVGFIEPNGTNIGRANVVTGSGADASIIGDAHGPCGVAVDGSHLYWANSAIGTIGRANLDATGVNQSFMATGGSQICGIAVDSLAPPPPTDSPPSNAFRFGNVKLNKKRGTATLAVIIPGPGKVALSGKGVTRRSFSPTNAGTVKLGVKATGRAKKTLERTGSAKVRAVIGFTPDGGTPSSQTKTIRLKLKKD